MTPEEFLRQQAEEAKLKQAGNGHDSNRDEDAIPAEYSDEQIALKFTETHGNELRYAAAWGKWLLWNRARWEFDETMRAFDFSRATCRAVSSGAPKKLASGIASARTVAGIISLARADRRHAATVDQWDAGDWTFNPPT
jgi:putative DNA primase/helicase